MLRLDIYTKNLDKKKKKNTESRPIIETVALKSNIYIKIKNIQFPIFYINKESVFVL